MLPHPPKTLPEPPSQPSPVSQQLQTPYDTSQSPFEHSPSHLLQPSPNTSTQPLAETFQEIPFETQTQSQTSLQPSGPAPTIIPTSDTESHKITEQQAEIERLQAQLVATTSPAPTFIPTSDTESQRKLSDQQAEIENLRAQLASRSPAMNEAQGKIFEQKAEIENLRAQLASRSPESQRTISEQQAEIEHLRAQLADTTSPSPHAPIDSYQLPLDTQSQTPSQLSTQSPAQPSSQYHNETAKNFSHLDTDSHLRDVLLPAVAVVGASGDGKWTFLRHCISEGNPKPLSAPPQAAGSTSADIHAYVGHLPEKDLDILLLDSEGTITQTRRDE
jgi:hypothetical protein